MIVKTIGEINEYTGESINPINLPDQKFELYSVPSFENGSPEIVTGKEIGSTKQRVQKNDILLCKINPRINRVWKVEQYTDLPLLASSEWIVIRSSQIYPDYLRWFLTSDSFRELLVSQVAGIGGSLTRAQPKQVKKYAVPLPSYHEQKHIAEVLDKINSLVSLRKQQLAKLDELVKARFVEMFGDPVLNDKRFCTIAGCNYFKLSNGKAVPEYKRFSTGIPVYGGNGISWYTDEVLCEDNTIVVGRVGFQSGNVHLVNGPLWISDNAI